MSNDHNTVSFKGTIANYLYFEMITIKLLFIVSRPFLLQQDLFFFFNYIKKRHFSIFFSGNDIYPKAL